jgi:CRISPR system Cascade subunit CasE
VTTYAHRDDAPIVVQVDGPADAPDNLPVTGPMILTRMELNRARAGTRRLLASPQSLHAAVASSLPPRGAARTVHDPFAALGPDDDDVPSRAEPPTGGRNPRGRGARLLWRVDHDGPHTTLYILSPGEPDLTHLVQQAGWPADSEPGWQSRSCTPLLAGLRHGQRWGFRLVANVTRTERQGREQSRRVGLSEPSDQARWLVERAPSLGFALVGSAGPGPVVDLVVADRRAVRFRRGGGLVTLSTVGFEGTIEVRDPALLRRALADGVGRGRAYGCGLLTLTPTA